MYGRLIIPLHTVWIDVLTLIILMMKSWRPVLRCLMKSGSKLFPRIRFPGNLSPISGNRFFSFSFRSWNSLYLGEGRGRGERGEGEGRVKKQGSDLVIGEGFVP